MLGNSTPHCLLYFPSQYPPLYTCIIVLVIGNKRLMETGMYSCIHVCQTCVRLREETELTLCHVTPKTTLYLVFVLWEELVHWTMYITHKQWLAQDLLLEIILNIIYARTSSENARTPLRSTSRSSQDRSYASYTSSNSSRVSSHNSHESLTTKVFLRGHRPCF